MPIVASDVIDMCRSTLLDAAGTAYTDNELLGWLNATMEMISSMKPDFIPKNTNLTLVAGVKQNLPDDGLVLLNAFRSDGAGGYISIVPISEFVRVHPFWVSDPQGPVNLVLYDPKVPTVFYVYPPAVNNTTITVYYGAEPVKVSATSDSLTGIPNRFLAALYEGVLGFAYTKSSLKQDFSKADFHMKRCWQLVLGDKTGITAVSAMPDITGVK
jgi:hypothetical protein